MRIHSDLLVVKNAKSSIYKIVDLESNIEI